MELKDVERLKQENVAIKLELQKLMSNNTHQNFHKNQPIEMSDQNSNLFMTDYGGGDRWKEEPEKRIDEENENHRNEDMMFRKNFHHPSIESTTTNKENMHTQKEMLGSVSSFQNTKNNAFSPRLTENTANEMFPSLNAKPPLSNLLEKRLSPQTTTANNSTNFNSFQIGASHLKESLKTKGRCPICTLPLP